MIVFVFVLIKVEVNESQSQRSTKGQQVKDSQWAILSRSGHKSDCRVVDVIQWCVNDVD